MTGIEQAASVKPPPSLVEDDRWRAVVGRNPHAESRFVYAVTTTGVFCRATCGARRPRRENVRFFDTAAAARAAGFRPCRRCRPEGEALPATHAEAAARACRTIEESAVLPTAAALAKAAAMSVSHFQRVFKQVTGLTPKAYAQAVRAGRVRESLSRPGTVTDAVYSAGFNSNSRFYAGSSEMLGMSPTSYRDGGGGHTIRFGVGQCSLGAILVAASAQGVCAVLLGDDPDLLVAELQSRFARADLVGADPEFEGWMARVIGQLESPAPDPGLPLDIRGTAFQHLVWQALRQIPIGSTASYSEIAERLGRPLAARAVAAACAANHLAVVIPCHRVVRADGSLSGYRWGVERKRELLRRESAPG